MDFPNSMDFPNHLKRDSPEDASDHEGQSPLNAVKRLKESKPDEDSGLPPFGVVQAQWKTHPKNDAEGKGAILEPLREAAVHATVENFRELALNYGVEILKAYGGPRGFLVQEAGEEPRNFWKDMVAFIGDRTDVDFRKELPGNDTEIFPLHIWDLSFDPSSSTKPAPFLAVSLQLLEEILMNGFQTQGA